MPTQYICETCGTPFTATLRSGKRLPRFCSKPCFGQSVTTKIKRLCAICGASYLARPDNLALGYARYCSKSCSNRARRSPMIERFLANVDRRGADECWLWLGTRHHTGYGVITGDDGVQRRTHRVAYELANGPLGPGMLACHRCDNPPCVNPGHLYAGTPLDNTRDKMTRGRHRNKYGPAPRR